MGCGGCGHKYYRPARTAVVRNAINTTGGAPVQQYRWKYVPRVARAANAPAPAVLDPNAVPKPKEG